jgi:hypothetical protein
MLVMLSVLVDGELDEPQAAARSAPRASVAASRARTDGAEHEKRHLGGVREFTTIRR